MASTEKLLPIARIFKVSPSHFVLCKIGTSSFGTSVVVESVVEVSGAVLSDGFGGSLEVEASPEQATRSKSDKTRQSVRRNIFFIWQLLLFRLITV